MYFIGAIYEERERESVYDDALCFTCTVRIIPASLLLFVQ